MRSKSLDVKLVAVEEENMKQKLFFCKSWLSLFKVRNLTMHLEYYLCCEIFFLKLQVNSMS